MQGNTVPAEPFRQILADRLERYEEAEYPDPRKQLAKDSDIPPRILLRILDGQKDISFDNADKIVTNILGPMAWHTSETLSAIYEGVNLRAVDWSHPTSRRVVEGMMALAEAVYEKHGTLHAASASIRVSPGALRRFLSGQVTA